MTIDAKINARAALRASHIDARTCRPDAAYPQAEAAPVQYVRQFSEALGLRPAPTLFGDDVVSV